MMLATIFHHPAELSSDDMLWLLLPLCAAVAIVYKTVRTKHLHRLAIETALLVGQMVAGLIALGAGLWAIQEYWP